MVTKHQINTQQSQGFTLLEVLIYLGLLSLLLLMAIHANMEYQKTSAMLNAETELQRDLTQTKAQISQLLLQAEEVSVNENKSAVTFHFGEGIAVLVFNPTTQTLELMRGTEKYILLTNISSSAENSTPNIFTLTNHSLEVKFMLFYANQKILPVEWILLY